MTAGSGTPSDEVAAIAACGAGSVTAAVLSLSEAAADGDDARYLLWHLRDHLPEQHRIAGVRHGARFVSTPACRAARLADGEAFAAVDHVVTYLFAPPVEASLDAFFDLGRALREAGRMPVTLPSVQVGGWWVDDACAAPAALVGAAVVPWRPATGVILLIEQVGEANDGAVPSDLASLAGVPGVVGVWSLRGGTDLHRRLADTSGLEVVIAYLDDDPVETIQRATTALEARWSAGARTPLLAAPFHAVDPAAIHQHLPKEQPS